MMHRKGRLLSLKEIEGPMGTHDAFLKHELDRRKNALACIEDASGLAEYLGAKVESLGRGESWAMSKDVFPGINILFVFDRPDVEFPANLRVLYFGDRIRDISGEDLADLTIACVNHMLRYVRATAEEPPEICTRV
ncbi:MAG: hypothetical protein NTU41_08310 [Chloroflexi bacterium]|nr:hypothetical protein [Chloroflexota bacterium]